MRATKFALALLAVVALPAAVSAAQFAVPRQADEGALVISGQHRNLYAAGGTVSLFSDIDGDVLAAGGQVDLHGSVEQDAALVAGRLSLDGAVGGDARLAGGDVFLNAAVGGDLVVLAGTVRTGRDATVGGDIVVLGGEVELTGDVTGNLTVRGGVVRVLGKVGGNVDVVADDGLTFGPRSQVTGTVSYRGKRPAVIQEGAVVPTIDFRETAPRLTFNGRALLTGALLVKILATIAAGLVFIRLFRKRVEHVVHGLVADPWRSLGVGFLGIVATPVAIILLLTTIIGYLAALMLAAWYVFSLLIAGLMSAITLGALIFQWVRKRPTLELRWEAVVIGAIVLPLLSLLPFVGWLVVAVIVSMVFGSLLRLIQDEFSQAI